MPNTNVGASTTPYQLVTRQRSFLPHHHFGQVGLFYSGYKDQRAEWGLFLGYGSTRRYFRAYIPTKRLIYSKRRFVPMTQIPTEWNFKNRIRPPDPPAIILPPTSPALPSLNHNVQTGVPLPYSATPPVPSSVRFEPSASSDHSGRAAATDRSEHSERVVDSVRPEHSEIVATSERPAASERAHAITSRRPRRTSVTPPVPALNPPPPQIPLEHNVLIEGVNRAATSTTSTNSRPKRSAASKTWKDGPVNARKNLAILAMKTSLESALKDPKRGPSIRKSIFTEIENLDKPGVLKPIKRNNIPKEFQKDIIGVHMFHKEKFKADGSFDKDKCRLVLLSNLRDPNTIGDTICPTVNPISVMVQLNLAAVEQGTLISAYDIKSAFLETRIKNGKRMFIRVNPKVARYWLERFPDRKQWVEPDGCLYFELKSYVYGLHEASHEFNNMLDQRLRAIGFIPAKVDECLYVKKVKDGRMILSVHVDDMLLTAPTKQCRKWFEQAIGKYFTLAEQHDQVSYLGMMIKKDGKGNVTVNQHGFLDNILKKYGCDNLRKAPVTPADDKLMTSDPASP
jgi:hypothetical protein